MFGACAAEAIPHNLALTVCTEHANLACLLGLHMLSVLFAMSCREEWLAQLVSELDSSDSYEFVKHLTDVHRLHLFDIVMQYRAIFFDTSSQVRLMTYCSAPHHEGRSLSACTLLPVQPGLRRRHAEHGSLAAPVLVSQTCPAVAVLCVCACGLCNMRAST
jgi:hypothetical protein